MNEFVCGLSGRWAIGPYCVEGSVLGGALIVVLVLVVLAIAMRVAGARRRQVPCPVCGRVYATRHQMVAHRWREHQDHEPSDRHSAAAGAGAADQQPKAQEEQRQQP